MTRTRICLYILLLAPLAVYWQSVFEDFGFRDDYSHLRESREEPAKLVKFTASQGRPLYGAMLETTFYMTEEVARLPFLRLISVVLLAVLALAIWRQLYHSGWTEVEAAAVGLGVTLLPAAQVVTAWAIAWPHVLALLLAVAGFAAIEAELERGGLKRFVAFLGGCLIYTLAGLIYQSNALFAVVLIAAVLLARTGREPMSDTKWLACHLAALGIGLAAGWVLLQAMFSSGVFQASPRLAYETAPHTKLLWFLWYPVANALGLYALRDDFATGAPVFWAVVAAVAGLIGAGMRVSLRSGGALMKRRWILCLAVLPLVAHAVSLVAAERSVGYRTLFALSGLVVVLVIFSLRTLLGAATGKPLLRYVALALLAAVVAFAANRNTYELIAEPQNAEWELVKNGLARLNFTKPTRLFIVLPALADRSTERVYADEFGSLSSDAEWTAKEMVAAALHERFKGKLPKGGSYTLEFGREPPLAGAYDKVIDLRKLKERRQP